MRPQGSRSKRLAARAARGRELALAALCTAVPPVATRNFRVPDTQTEDDPTVQAQLMLRLVDARTGGGHRIRNCHSRRLDRRRVQ
ncbi:MAG: hypothetical protein IRZ09_06600 [Variibacter sp.]|nr:hypothetical protein [Variibacter sp.]